MDERERVLDGVSAMRSHYVGALLAEEGWCCGGPGRYVPSLPKDDALAPNAPTAYVTAR